MPSLPYTHIPISQLAEQDRPREKMLDRGRKALTDAELLAILLGSGTRTRSAIDVARLLLGRADNDLHRLSCMEVKDFTSIEGIGKVKALTIISALELGRRRKEQERKDRLKITRSADVFEYIGPELLDLPHEELWVLLLNRNNEVMRKERVSQGGVAGTVADPKLIFKKAVDHMASAIVLVHNHPSGNVTPSRADIALTRKVKEGGDLLDVTLLDHLVFGGDRYYSFADEGLL